MHVWNDNGTQAGFQIIHWTSKSLGPVAQQYNSPPKKGIRTVQNESRILWRMLTYRNENQFNFPHQDYKPVQISEIWFN